MVAAPLWPEAKEDAWQIGNKDNLRANNDADVSEDQNMSTLSAIHTGLKLLHIEEEDGRDLYERMTGKRSLRAMTDEEQGKVVAELRRLGFKPRSGGSQTALNGRYAPIMRALWLSAYNLGVVKNPDDHALIAFVFRQTQIEHLAWVRDAESSSKAIDGLKAWMRRECDNDALFRGREYWAHDFQQNPKVQVIFIQWDILDRAGKTPAQTIYGWLGAARYNEMVAKKKTTLHEIQNDLGKLVRAL